MPADARTASRRIAGLDCTDVAEALPVLLDGGRGPDAHVEAHVRECLRCQAELAQYRRLLRALRALRTEVLDPAPGAVSAVLASVAASTEAGAARALLRGHRAAYLGGLAVATAAAGTAAAVVVVTRTGRRERGRLAG